MAKEGRVIRQGISAFKHFLIPQSMEGEFKADCYRLTKHDFDNKYNEYWFGLDSIVIYEAEL